jgi:hypothetical protein
MSTEIATLSEKQEAELVEAVEACHIASAMKNDTVKSLRLAHGMNQLRQVLATPEITNLIMGFQNIPIGFVTDSKTGYTKDVVINCALEALTAGAYLHGNEFNIIAGRCYFAQSFFVRMLREFCTKHKIERRFSYQAKYLQASCKQHKFNVKVGIYWKLPKDKEMRETCESYNLLGMTEDQVIGKAKKRAHQWLFNELTENNYILAPDDSEPFFEMPTEPETDMSKPDFDPNPDPIAHLSEKYGAVNVSGYLKEIGMLTIKETIKDISEENKGIIGSNLEEFDKQIKGFSEV